ncbi:MAG: methyltransferase, partial [Candidatus Poribacteria bacterium]
RLRTKTMKNNDINLEYLTWGYRASRVLQVANNLDIFTVLSEGEMSVGEVSERCYTKRDMTEKLLIACTAMGLLEKEDEKYANSEFADTYLVRGRKLYQGDIIAHSASVWNFWHRLEDEIRLENAPKDDKPNGHRNFIMAMHNIAISGRAKMLADNVDLSGRKKLFDVGGGPGTYSITLCQRYPQLKAVVFDLPDTIAITREVIAKEGMEDRVSVKEGSWDTETFGDGNDVALLSNVLHGSGSKAEMKLKKAYDSMTDDGLLIIQDFVLNDDKTGPLTPALFNIMVGAYSRPELFAVIKSAGFVRPKIIVSSKEHGSTVITAVKSSISVVANFPR